MTPSWAGSPTLTPPPPPGWDLPSPPPWMEPMGLQGPQAGSPGCFTQVWSCQPTPSPQTPPQHLGDPRCGWFPGFPPTPWNPTAGSLWPPPSALGRRRRGRSPLSRRSHCCSGWWWQRRHRRPGGDREGGSPTPERLPYPAGSSEAVASPGGHQAHCPQRCGAAGLGGPGRTCASVSLMSSRAGEPVWPPQRYSVRRLKPSRPVQYSRRQGCCISRGGRWGPSWGRAGSVRAGRLLLSILPPPRASP